MLLDWLNEWNGCQIETEGKGVLLVINVCLDSPSKVGCVLNNGQNFQRVDEKWSISSLGDFDFIHFWADANRYETSPSFSFHFLSSIFFLFLSTILVFHILKQWSRSHGVRVGVNESISRLGPGAFLCVSWALRRWAGSEFWDTQNQSLIKCSGCMVTMQREFQVYTLQGYLFLCNELLWNSVALNSNNHFIIFHYFVGCQFGSSQLGDASVPPWVAWDCSGYSAAAGLI